MTENDLILQMVNAAIADSHDINHPDLQEKARRYLLSQHCANLCDDIIDYAEMVAHLRAAWGSSQHHQLH